MTAESTFAGKRVTVFGLGFLGFHLTSRLHELGARVTVLTRRRTPTVIDRLLPGIQVLEADVRDDDAVRRAIENTTAVFNVCGQSGTTASKADPAGDLSVNCGGVLTILDAVRRFQPQARVVFAGSRLQFGPPLTLPVGEDHPQLPTSFYGIHKMTAEAYHRAYCQLHGVPTTVLRLSNPYGLEPGGPRAGYNILNNFIRLALEDREIEVFDPGHQTRDYIHVSDVVEAFVDAASNEGAIGETFNIGSGVETRLIDAVSTIVHVVGRGRVRLTPWPDEYRVIETGDFVFDIGKARRHLNWSPKVSFEQGVAMTVEAARREVVP